MKRLKFLAVFLVVLTLHQSISVCAVEITANDLKATTELHVKNDTNEKNNSNSTTSTENNSSTGKRCTIVLSDSGQWSVGSAPGEPGHCQLVLGAAEDKQRENFTEKVRSLQHDLQRVLQKFKKLGEPVPPSVERSLQEHLKSLLTNEERREAVKAMAREAWRAVKSSSQTPTTDWETKQSVVGALSTLQVMGLVTEVEEARRLLLVERALQLEDYTEVAAVKGVNVQLIGGLLSMFALTGSADRRLLEVASSVARAVKPAYNTSLELPYPFFNFSSGKQTLIGSGYDPDLATAGGDYLEAVYLGDLTDDRDQVKERAGRIKAKLVQLRPKSPKTGEYYFPYLVNLEYAVFSNQLVLNQQTSAFYRSLLTSAIQSGKRDLEKLLLYNETIHGLIKIELLQGNDSTGLGLATYKGVKKGNIFNQYPTYMDYTACFVGGMLALGAKEIEKYSNFTKNLTLETAVQHWKLAIQLAETCYQAATRTATKLGPLNFYPQDFSQRAVSRYNLDHEYAETNFFLWRLTGDVKYRERSWEMAQAIAKHCKVRNGSGFKPYLNVESLDEPYIDVEKAQPAAFLSGTLKYLYLTFAPTDVLPLDKWVFNAVGHPLPICGQHPEAVYPTKYCSKKKQLFDQEKSATTTERVVKSSPPPPPPPVAAQ